MSVVAAADVLVVDEYLGDCGGAVGFFDHFLAFFFVVFYIDFGVLNVFTIEKGFYFVTEGAVGLGVNYYCGHIVCGYV